MFTTQAHLRLHGERLIELEEAEAEEEEEEEEEWRSWFALHELLFRDLSLHMRYPYSLHNKSHIFPFTCLRSRIVPIFVPSNE